MQLADSQTDAGLYRSPKGSTIRLRISCPGAPDRFVDLHQDKTTIGSSPRCNLRIVQPGVQPVHLLIVHDAAGPVARRWAADALLNGESFDEATLSDGDRLSLGTVVLEAEIVKECADRQINAGPDWPHEGQTDHVAPSLHTEPAGQTGSDGDASIGGTSAALSQFDAIEENLAKAIEPKPVEPQPASKSTQANRRKIRAAIRRNRNECRRLAERVEALECLMQAALAVWDAQQPLVGDPSSRDSLQTGELQGGDETASKSSDIALQTPVGERTVGEAHQSEWEVSQRDFDESTATSPPAPATAEFDWSTVRTSRSSTAFSSQPPEPAQPPEHAPTPRSDAAVAWGESRGAQLSANPWDPGDTPQRDLQQGWHDSHRAGSIDPLPVELQTESPVPTPTSYAENHWLDDAKDEHMADATDDLAAFVQFSIWNQGTGAAESAVENEEHVAARPDELSSDGDSHRASALGTAAFEPKSTAPAKTSSTESFIDRYAHLFADDNQRLEQAPAGSSAITSRTDGMVETARPIAAAAPAAVEQSTDGDEETIEQYMAKLLQRVRGGAPYTPEPTSLKHTERQHDAGRPDTPDRVPPNASEPQSPARDSQLADVPAGEERVTTSLGTVRRKSTVVEPPANLEAFRALANESARRAIGTHAQRIHRRNALTKAIVATLAGMTSLWLMLEAPGWYDVQFISACTALLAAAYWAGQTYGTLLEAYRAGSYGGPQIAVDNHGDPFHPALPIDVEQSKAN